MHVLIADDHPLVRRALVELLRSAHPDWTFSEVGTFDEVQLLCANTAVDLASIDLLMPGVDGPGSFAELRRAFPALRVIVLTGTEDRPTILECVAAGIHGYVLKSAAAEHLQRAVEMVVEGGIYLPATLVGALGNVPSPGRQPGRPGMQEPAAPAVIPVAELTERVGDLQGLTGRQRDVLKLLAQGCSTKDIARKLNLGIGTVKVHLAGLYKSLGAHNRMEAVVKAGRALQN